MQQKGRGGPSLRVFKDRFAQFANQPARVLEQLYDCGWPFGLV